MALMDAGARMVMLTVAVRLVCAWAIAVIVTMFCAPAGWTAGAVYKPLVSIMPKVALPPVTPLTCHVASVLFRFEIKAVHCEVAFAFTEVRVQLAEIVGTAAGVGAAPHEFKISTAGSSANTSRKYCQ